MRNAILLAIAAALLVFAGWNVSAVCDALVAIYTNGTVRQGMAITAFALGIAACIAALVVMARQSERVVNSDFDEDAKRQMDWQS